MAHFAFIAPPLPGHYNPLGALARALIARGHRATFVHRPDAAYLVRDECIGFHGIGGETHPPGSLEATIRNLARVNGPAGAMRMIRAVAADTDMVARQAPAALCDIGADAVVADQLEPGGALAAFELGLPYVTTATGLLTNREPGVPPPYVAWPYDPSERGLWWNQGGYRIAGLLMHPIDKVVAHHAERLGLAGIARGDQLFSPNAQLFQGIASLDFPRTQLPPGFHYLGPFRDPDTARWTLAERDGRPLVFCSLGTLQGSRAKIFRKVAAVCHALGLRLVVAHGGRLDPAEAASLPGDPLVYDFVPQRAVLAQCALAITHAGFNTVLDALSFGVPLVAIPLAFEQPATAARLAYAGVGEIVPKGCGEARLRRAVEQVLHDPGYRLAADAMREQIAAAGGVERAADLAEACV